MTDDVGGVPAGYLGMGMHNVARRDRDVAHLAEHLVLELRQFPNVNDERVPPPPESVVYQRCADAFDIGQLFINGHRSKTDGEIIRFIRDRS